MNKILVGIIFIVAGLVYGSFAVDVIYDHTLGWLVEHNWIKPPPLPLEGPQKNLLGRKNNNFTLWWRFNNYRFIYFMEQEQLILTLEALLFTASRPLRAKDFAKILEIEEAEITAALDKMVGARVNYGIVLLNSGGDYQLATNSKFSTQVKNFLNAELREKLTDATVEVLAIIAYRQPISKAEIEAIRGVNSQYSVRHLLMRGLIEKIQNPSDARSFLYQTTTEFLMHLGLTSTKDLPEFEKLVSQIKLPETPALTNQATSEIPETVMPAEPASETVETPTPPAEEAPDPEQKTPETEVAAEDKEDKNEETDDDEDDEDDDDDK